MSKTAEAAHRYAKPALRLAIIAACLFLVLASEGRAQVRSATDGTTPLGLTPGAPAGSYSLSGFDSINPYNGNLNFSLPLLQIGGRGQVQHVIPLMIENHWRTLENTNSPSHGYTPEFNVWTGPRPGYSPGILSSRMVGINPFHGPCVAEQPSINRLTFTGPDGTETELRDVLHEGAEGLNHYHVDAPDPPGTCVLDYTTSRGRVFVSSDGSMTYINDTDISDFYALEITQWPDVSGYLLMGDGTRYRIDGQRVTWIQDRNGNRMTFQYGAYGDVSQITDSLNRVVNISYTYQYSESDPHYSYDEITYTGFGGAPRSIKIYYDDMANCLRSGRPGDLGLMTYSQLFPELNLADTQNYHHPTKVSRIVLPDARQYQFFYNAYGDLARVVLPTGGMTEYDWAAAVRDGNASGVFGGGNQIYRRVVQKRIYADAGSIYESRTDFSRPEYINGATLGNDGYVEVTQHDYSGALLARSLHYYYGNATDSYWWNLLHPTYYSKWLEGKEQKTEVYDIDGTLKQRITNTWHNTTLGWWGGGPDDPTAPPNHSQIGDTTTKLADTNLLSKQEFDYDLFNNKTEVREFDFGSPQVGSLLRRTHTTYVTSNAYTAVLPNNTNPNPSLTVHLRSLPLQQSVYDGTGAEKARTIY